MVPDEKQEKRHPVAEQRTAAAEGMAVIGGTRPW